MFKTAISLRFIGIINTFIRNKNIIANIYRIQANN